MAEDAELTADELRAQVAVYEALLAQAGAELEETVDPETVPEDAGGRAALWTNALDELDEVGDAADAPMEVDTGAASEAAALAQEVAAMEAKIASAQAIKAATVDSTVATETTAGDADVEMGSAPAEVIGSLLGGYDSDAESEDQGGDAPPVAASGSGHSPSASSSKEFFVSVGCSVQVTGLLQAAHLNGQRGVVKQLDPNRSDRWEVELRLNCGCTEVKHIRTTNLFSASSAKQPWSDKDTDLQPGCVVQIEGLQKAAHLNGQHALVVKSDAAGKDGMAERCDVEVHFPDGRREIKAIRPENLKLNGKLVCSAAASATATPAAAPVTAGTATLPKCGECGAEYTKELAKFCADCGATRGTAPATAQTKVDAPAKTPPKPETPQPTSVGPPKPGTPVKSDSTVGPPKHGTPEGMVGPSKPDAAAFKIGSIVRIHGLKAEHLNGIVATVERFDPTLGRWEVKAPDGSIKAIKAQNLAVEVQAETKPAASGVEEAGEQAGDDGLEGDVDETLDMELEGDDDDADMEKSGDEEEDDEDEEEGDGFEAGATVRLDGLQAAAHLNGQSGVLECFDPSLDRWQVKMPNGEIKALKPVNLTLVVVPGAAESEPKKSKPASGAMGTDAISKMDDNEIAAKALEAELDGDDDTAKRLNEELTKRRAGIKTDAFTEETMQIPIDMVGHIIGVGGCMINQISADCGIKLKFLNSEEDNPQVRVLWIRGPASAVAKAHSAVEEVMKDCEEDGNGGGDRGRDRKGKGKGKGKGRSKGVKVDLADGAAGAEAGICKWFAAGFCRNRPMPGTHSCRNGLHDSAAARQAEKDWIAEAPETGTQGPPGKRPIILLLDLEGGGNADGIDGEDEIIELPTLALCPTTGKELGRFHRFVRPGFWDRESDYMHRKFPPECFNNDCASEPFPQVIASLMEWIPRVLGTPGQKLCSDDFLFVTCGKWDVKTALPRQSNKPFPGAPTSVDVATQQLLFSRWSNLKEVFQKHYKLDDAKTPTGMRGMLKRLRIPLSGQHHLGMDDVTNLSKILKIIVAAGGKIEPTGTANNLAGDAAAAKRAYAKGGGKKGSSKGTFRMYDKGDGVKGYSAKGGKDDAAKGGKGDFAKGGKGDFSKGGKGDLSKGGKFNKGGSSKDDWSKGSKDSKSKGKACFSNHSSGPPSMVPPPGAPPPTMAPPPGAPPPPAAGTKRPAEEAPVESSCQQVPTRAVAPRKESWNPWAEATEKQDVAPRTDSWRWKDGSEQFVAPDEAQTELHDFLKAAPRPGEDWEIDDADEEEETVASKSQAPGSGEDEGLGGVLGASSDAAPAQAPSLASLFASLPKPVASDS